LLGHSFQSVSFLLRNAEAIPKPVTCARVHLRAVVYIGQSGQNVHVSKHDLFFRGPEQRMFHKYMILLKSKLNIVILSTLFPGHAESSGTILITRCEKVVVNMP
jgi:hypothetical protein